MAKEEEPRGRCSANDNGSRSGEPLDPRILRIAEAVGRQLARAQGNPPAATMKINHGGDSNIGNGFPKTGLGFSDPPMSSSCMAQSHR
jgi:hypothetical protein